MNIRSYEPGMGKVGWIEDPNELDPTTVQYYHTDMLGTTRYMTTPDDGQKERGGATGGGLATEGATYTAFGERIDGTNHRYGYAGTHGYRAQDTGEDPGSDPVPFLHVGARYYDPAIGRFLQRDPIGIRGGLNVYAYVGNSPTSLIDPSGLGWLRRAWNWVLDSAKKAASKLMGKSPPPIAGPIMPMTGALEGAPDLFRITMACQGRWKAAKGDKDADGMLDAMEGNQGNVKPGNGN